MKDLQTYLYHGLHRLMYPERYRAATLRHYHKNKEKYKSFNKEFFKKHPNYRRQWYQRNGDAAREQARIRSKKEAYKRMNRAKRAVLVAVRKGKLIKPKVCQNCQKISDIIHGHHVDYSKPLDVQWLCPNCHSQWHVEKRKTNIS